MFTSLEGFSTQIRQTCLFYTIIKNLTQELRNREEELCSFLHQQKMFQCSFGYISKASLLSKKLVPAIINRATSLLLFVATIFKK